MFVSVLLTTVSLVDIVSSIVCYKCLSINGSNPACEDLFQGDVRGFPSLLHTPCLTHVPGRQGLFPATHCIKLVAWSGGADPVRYMYRTCGRDESTHTDKVGTSHCGFVKLAWIDRRRRFRGCLHTCERDACNGAESRVSSWHAKLFLIMLMLIIVMNERKVPL